MNLPLKKGSRTPPDLELEDGAWQYDTRRPGWRLIDFSGGGLLVTFTDSDDVKGIVNNTWID